MKYRTIAFYQKPVACFPNGDIAHNMQHSHSTQYCDPHYGPESSNLSFNLLNDTVQHHEEISVKRPMTSYNVMPTKAILEVDSLQK